VSERVGVSEHVGHMTRHHFGVSMLRSSTITTKYYVISIDNI
jgi:hypothetical protein